MDGTAGAALEALARTQAVLKGHFRLASGLHSDTYIQKFRLFQHPSIAGPLASAMAEQWRGAEAPTVVAAPAVGAILLGYELARALRVRSIFLERKDGTFAPRLGMDLEPGQKVLCAEDVVTTGGSVLEMARVIEGLGAEVIGFAALIDRSSAPPPFHKPFRSLLKLSPAQYKPEACPLCATGKPLDTPGSSRRREGT
jgi:orotate phosphoribosyltransferase